MRFKIWFRYEIVKAGVLTVCVIADPSRIGKDGKWLILCEGVATCSHDDNFSRAKGRKLSLLRAANGLPKNDRGAIIESWFAQHPNDRSQKL